MLLELIVLLGLLGLEDEDVDLFGLVSLNELAVIVVVIGSWKVYVTEHLTHNLCCQR